MSEGKEGRKELEALKLYQHFSRTFFSKNDLASVDKTVDRVSLFASL